MHGAVPCGEENDPCHIMQLHTVVMSKRKQADAAYTSCIELTEIMIRVGLHGIESF